MIYISIWLGYLISKDLWIGFNFEFGSHDKRSPSTVDVGWQWFTSFQTKSLPALWEAIIHLNYCTLKLDHRKSHVAHFSKNVLWTFFSPKIFFEPACLPTPQILTGFPAADLITCLLLLLPWLHDGWSWVIKIMLQFFTPATTCTVSISTWTHSIHFVWWSGARLKFSSLIATCRLTTITLNTVGQFWILIWHSPKYEHGTLNIENWLWILLASKKPYTEISTPCCSSASWLRDRWCTRWCLRPAESCSSWSSAVRLKLSGFRFKEKAEAAATGVHCNLRLELRFQSNIPSLPTSPHGFDCSN